MLSAFDETMLRRAMRVAMNGRGRVEPNPMVGCVLVKNGTVIAEGHHTHFGGPHAEPAALADCQARGNSPVGATAYVTLEPCCHTNKKTPPCAPRLIEAGIARVVIGCLDPNPAVDGNGVRMLKAAGIHVNVAPDRVAAEFRQLIAPFVAGEKYGRPYVTLKWAQTSDGRVGGPGRTPLRITGPHANLAVHRLRTRSHAIAIGIGTALSDDPRLTVRGVPVIHHPVRLVIDSALRLPPTARVLEGGGTRVLCQPRGYLEREPMQALSKAGATLFPDLGQHRFQDDSLLFTKAFADLVGKHVLTEPGPTLAAAWLPWADRLWVFTSGRAFPSGPKDGPSSPHSPNIPDHYIQTGRMTIGEDTLVEYLNQHSKVFAAGAPSADFVLESENEGAALTP